MLPVASPPPSQRRGGIDIAELQRISAEKKRQRDDAGFEDPTVSRPTSARPKTPFQKELEEKLASRETSRVSTPAFHANKTVFNIDWQDFRSLFNYFLENGVTEVTQHIPHDYIAMSHKNQGLMKSTQPKGGLPDIRESLRNAFNAHLQYQGEKPQHLHQSAMETVSYKTAVSAPTDEASTEMGTERGVANYAQKMSDMGDVVGKGMRIFPIQGRNHYIKGRGLRNVQVDTSRGVQPTATYVPFGKYVINPSRLKTSRLELRTLRGGAVVKYPTRDLTANIAKILRRVLEDRMPDVLDLRELSAKEAVELWFS
jgi:hypothetical protein